MKYLFFLFSLCLFTITTKAQTPFFPQFNPETEKWSYLDITGKPVMELSLANIEDLKPFSNGIAGAFDATTQLWGFIDTTGQWIIKPKYATIQSFVDGYAIVSNPCDANCNTSTEGLLRSDISYIIDTKGNIVFTDKSQEANPQSRFFLDKNLGAGLFRVIMGFGENDMKNIINLKGDFLCKTYSVFGAGDIEYEADLKAYKCQNIFYNTSGVKVLDLSKYSFVNPFSEGYAWVNKDEEKDGENITWNILIDLKGKEVLRFKSDEIVSPKPVENGAFLYADAENNTFKYILKEKRSVAFDSPETEEITGLTFGEKQKNGIRYIYSADESARLVGFVSAAGEAFYKNP